MVIAEKSLNAATGGQFVFDRAGLVREEISEQQAAQLFAQESKTAESRLTGDLARGFTFFRGVVWDGPRWVGLVRCRVWPINASAGAR